MRLVVAQPLLLFLLVAHPVIVSCQPFTLNVPSVRNRGTLMKCVALVPFSSALCVFRLFSCDTREVINFLT